MLAKENRLTKDKEYDAVFKQGRSSYDQILGVKTAKKEEGESRFGVIISSKVSKKAVVRNKIKRRITEIIRPMLAELLYKSDVVIIVLPVAAKKEFSDFQNSLIYHFKRLKIIK